MRQRMGHTAAVADNIQAFVFCLKVFINGHFHVIELNFHTLKQSVSIGRTRSNLVQCIDHLNDAIQDTLRQHQT